MELQKGVKKCKGSFRQNTKDQRWSNHPSLKFQTFCPVFTVRSKKYCTVSCSMGSKSVSFMKDEHGCRCATLACHHHSSSGFEQSTLCGVRLSRSRPLSVCLNASKWPFSTRLVPSLHCLVADAALEAKHAEWPQILSQLPFPKPSEPKPMP